MRLVSLVGWEKSVTEHTMLFYLDYMLWGNVFSRMSQCFEWISTFTAKIRRHFFCCSNSMHSKQVFSVVSFTRCLHNPFIADYWFSRFFAFSDITFGYHHSRTFVNISTSLALQSISSHAITIGCSFDVFLIIRKDPVRSSKKSNMVGDQEILQCINVLIEQIACLDVLSCFPWTIITIRLRSEINSEVISEVLLLN